MYWRQTIRFFREGGGEYWKPNPANKYLRSGKRRSKSRLDEIGSVGTLAPEIEDEFLIWRVWQKKGVPLDELRNRWTYEDLLHANAVLDMDEDIEAAVDGLIDFESKHGGKQ